MIRRVRSVAVALAVATVLFGGACTRDGDTTRLEGRKPERVPDAIVPASVQGGALAFYRNQDDKTVDTFKNAGPKVLVADGQLWELRKNDRLLGALQLSTLVPKVDLMNRSHREQIVRQIMAGAVERFTIGDATVWSTTSNDKTVYLWFGKQAFSVLSLKGSELDAEAIVTEVVEFQTKAPKWRPLLINEDPQQEN